jgi:HK97 family phage major capsid protein
VDGTNAVAWAGTSPTYAELCELIGYLKGGYHGNAKFALNRQTFWQHIQAIRDDSKAKIVNDAGDRILGYPILFDDTLASGDIFFGNYKKINGNLSQDISIERSTESGFKYGAIDFRGMCMFDCKCPVGDHL